ncbi:hypothetical protein MKW94_028180 [Papaver nudicaule]|uniref:Pectinesterase inhibitor domain-containing protein n=1 Tax=Papaver nudicaule TaxID=74823 RepID=A0AA41RWD4_PAPNU|nr:hypothetical protein [Papaver nudicaule]
MAICSYSNSLICLVVLFLTMTSSTTKRDIITFPSNAHIDVSKLCSLVKNKDYCTNVLFSFPGIYGLYAKDIGDIFIDQAMYGAKDANNKLMDLIPKARGAQKSHLKYCKGPYCNQFYTSFLQKEQGNLSWLLGQQDYIGLKREADILAKHAIDCEESFKPAPSPLMTLQNTNFFNSVDMISTFSYLLIHQ